MACRITLLERLMLEQLIITNDDEETRDIIDKMASQILRTNYNLNKFISMNDGREYLGEYDVNTSIDRIFDTTMRGGSASARRRNGRILRAMIFARDNGTIPHYFILYTLL